MGVKIQTLEKTITTPNQVVKISEELDQDFERLTGIGILWTMGKKNRFLTSSLAGTELFPKNFPVAFLQSNTYVSPNDRFFKLNDKADGDKIELDYQDGGQHAYYPYTLEIFLRLENDK